MRNWITVAIIAILVIVAGYFVSANVQEKGEITPSAVSHQEEVKRIKVSVTINPGNEAQVLSVQDVGIEEGQTALEVTKKATGGKVALDNGGLVDSINGVKADKSKKEYWAFYVNGEYAKVGPGEYKVKQGDKIEWQISKF